MNINPSFRVPSPSLAALTFSSSSLTNYATAAWASHFHAGITFGKRGGIT
jgi:hypothetical protein